MSKSPDKKRAKGPAKVKASAKAKAPAKAQFAALPWRRTADGRLEILMITSRETRRSVIPKGWPIKGLTPNMTAMQEAYEEAGIEGYISMAPVGSYDYVKIMPTGRGQKVHVDVYGLEVSEEHLGFPEMHERTKFWVSPSAAAEMVDEPELKALISAFDPAHPAPRTS
jgi:8-oxo-dGTP pyrophosphatase MutT (NUDIX family)